MTALILWLIKNIVNSDQGLIRLQSSDLGINQRFATISYDMSLCWRWWLATRHVRNLLIIWSCYFFTPSTDHVVGLATASCLTWHSRAREYQPSMANDLRVLQKVELIEMRWNERQVDGWRQLRSTTLPDIAGAWIDLDSCLLRFRAPTRPVGWVRKRNVLQITNNTGVSDGFGVASLLLSVMR